MNEHDSARMASPSSGLVGPGGAAESAGPGAAHTCAIREKGEDKLYFALGRYPMVKALRGRVIGVSRLRRAAREGGPLRAGSVRRLRARPGPNRARSAELAEAGWGCDRLGPPPRSTCSAANPESARGKATAFVTDIKGCDKRLQASAVVPHTRAGAAHVSALRANRGREGGVVGRGGGCGEVYLDRQNVNSLCGRMPALAQLIPAALAARCGPCGGIRFHHEPSDGPVPPGAVVRLLPRGGQVMLMFPPAGASTAPTRCSSACGGATRSPSTRAGVASRPRRLPGGGADERHHLRFPGETEEEHGRTLALLGRVPYDTSSARLQRAPHTAAALRLSRSARRRSAARTGWGPAPGCYPAPRGKCSGSSRGIR